MKNFNRFIVLLIMVCANLYAEDCKSILKVTASDSSALIFINDKFTGKGNVSTEVEKGKYVVTVKESLVKWNGCEMFDTCSVDECDKEYSLNFNVTKKIFLDSRPQNAAIIENDTIIGYTPQFTDVNRSKKLQLQKGSAITEVKYNSLLENKIQRIDFKPESKTQSFMDSDLFKVLLGSATALGASAAYFKLKADKKYDNYLIGKDRATLDEVDRLDLYSGIALGLLQVNIGYLIYKILTD